MLKHCDLATNILRGRINISASYREKLEDYAYVIRSLVSNRISLSRKKRTLMTQHRLIPLLIKPVFYLLDES
jgi:hypothetical protein